MYKLGSLVELVSTTAQIVVAIGAMKLWNLAKYIFSHEWERPDLDILLLNPIVLNFVLTLLPCLPYYRHDICRTSQTRQPVLLAGTDNKSVFTGLQS